MKEFSGKFSITVALGEAVKLQMDGLHLAAVGIIKPVVNFLTNSSVPVNTLLRESGLGFYNLNNPYNYVPAKKMHVFLDMASRELRNDIYPILFNNQVRIATIGIVGDNVLSCPDLLAAINYGAKYNYLKLSSERMGLKIDAQVATVRYWYTDKPLPGRTEVELLSFYLLLDGIRAFTGTDWSPVAIQIQGSEVPEFNSLVSLANETDVRFNQPVTSVSFPASFLTANLVNRVHFKQKIERMWLPGHNIKDKLHCVLNSTNRQIDLGRASELFCVSSKTLMRYLRDEGTTYSEIVDQWRLKKALTLLEDSHYTVNEISQELHYSNAPNFIRAFTRWTGASPMSYREKFF